jgi:HlyD family secretion protein
MLLAASCKPSSPQNSVSGTIETDEVRVASRYGGRVAQIIAQEGDTLKTNQVIAELAAPELRARRDQMAAELAEWEAGPRKEELEAARHDWEAVAAELQQAQADAQRAELLLKTKTISPTEQEQAATKARTLAKNEAAAKSRYELLKAGTRPERLAQARAQLAEIDAQLNEMKIVAPSDCVLEVLDVKVGDVLPAGREVATLLLPQHLWVRVYVPETWLGHIQVGQKVNVHVDAEPKKGFQGTVEQVAREAEFTPRNVQTVGERIKQVFGIKVRLEAQDGQLRPGMAADVGFPEIKP